MNKIETMENKNKIVIWEGFRKELPWILFWLLLGMMVYGYYQDKKICDEVLADPCGACYKLNETLMDSNYLFTKRISTYNEVHINESELLLKDKNPNSRTISIYK